VLLRGKIPSLEPRIRVGIILPEDELKTATINFPNPKFYVVRSSLSQPTSDTLTVTINNGELSLAGLGVHKIKIQRITATNKLAQPLVVNNVQAGRGFHWKKAIDVALLGDLEIQVKDDNILIVNELPLEQYLMCVATSEMSAECPSALIESQTIVARAWMLANVEQKHRSLGFDVCNDDCCQRYHGTGNLTQQAIAGAQATRGQVIMYDNLICDARYSKSCGGMTERFEVIWDGPPLPYMQNIFDASNHFDWPDLPLSEEHNLRKWVDAIPDCFCSPAVVPEEILIKYIGDVDEEGQYYRWQFDYSQQEMTAMLNNKLTIEASCIINILPLERGGSGRLNKIKIEYLDTSEKTNFLEVDTEYRVRQVLHHSFLYSSAFYIERSGFVDKIPGKFTLRGAGWGHGAGLCQIGALGMALKGYKTSDILNHYYPGSRLVTLYS